MFFVKAAYKKHRAKFVDLLLRAGSDKSKAEFILHAIERENTGGREICLRMIELMPRFALQNRDLD